MPLECTSLIRENVLVHSSDKASAASVVKSLKTHSFSEIVGTSVTLSGPRVNLAGERRDARANGTYDVVLRASILSLGRRRRRRRRRRCRVNTTKGEHRRCRGLSDEVSAE
jgi:hypothetical protein